MPFGCPWFVAKVASTSPDDKIKSVRRPYTTVKEKGERYPMIIKDANNQFDKIPQASFRYFSLSYIWKMTKLYLYGRNKISFSQCSPARIHSESLGRVVCHRWLTERRQVLPESIRADFSTARASLLREIYAGCTESIYPTIKIRITMIKEILLLQYN